MRVTDQEHEAGLATPLPAGERILWQGKPDPRYFPAQIFRFRLLFGWLVAISLIIFLTSLDGSGAGPQALAKALLLVPAGLISWVLLTVIGRLSARAATYTLTNRRLILKIGVAMDMTVSVPLSAIVSAAVRPGRGSSGDVALSVKDRGGLGYAALWPHARPFRLREPQPMLRSVADVDHVCAIVGDALVDFNAGGRRAAMSPAYERGVQTVDAGEAVPA